ncbi:MAG: histone deacetylase, partial [Planctomycetota bacterium]
ERSRRSTGASIAAAFSACSEGISANLAGGTHHSFADSGQGYCVFNDTCVAARVLQDQELVKKVAFIDLDVHQGNGTSSIAVNDPMLFSFSMHCAENYPFKKTAGDLDVALPPKCGDDEYLVRLKESLHLIFANFQPEFAFYLAGADPFEGDRLGRLSLSKSGLRQRDELVINYCRDSEIPIAICMAGGYAPDPNDIVDIHYATIKAASERYLKDRIGL